VAAETLKGVVLPKALARLAVDLAVSSVDLTG
jgi:hypothetical protein